MTSVVSCVAFIRTVKIMAGAKGNLDSLGGSMNGCRGPHATLTPLLESAQRFHDPAAQLAAQQAVPAWLRLPRILSQESLCPYLLVFFLDSSVQTEGGQLCLCGIKRGIHREWLVEWHLRAPCEGTLVISTPSSSPMLPCSEPCSRPYLGDAIFGTAAPRLAEACMQALQLMSELWNMIALKESADRPLQSVNMH